MNVWSHPTTLTLLCALLCAQTENLSAQDVDKYSPSFIKGIIEGCIDGQKKLLSGKGLSYFENEELVRQYCYCMAPISADIASTIEGRKRILDGDPEVKKRVKKTEAICLDGVKNGRTFAPVLAQVSPAASYSSQENACGRITGTYWSALSVTEVCAEYSNLRQQSKAVAQAYTEGNRNFYDKASQRMQKLATEHGGKAAAEKLQAEVDQMISNKTYMLNEVRKTASSEATCSIMLGNLKRGDWDIIRRNPQELKVILGG